MRIELQLELMETAKALVDAHHVQRSYPNDLGAYRQEVIDTFNLLKAQVKAESEL